MIFLVNLYRNSLNIEKILINFAWFFGERQVGELEFAKRLKINEIRLVIVVVCLIYVSGHS